MLLEPIANGELHLTGLLMLGPHLTPENVVQVLGRAKFRTKKELAKLVRELHPLPLVADSIEPLGVHPRPLRAPTWAEYVSARAPAVRELRPGERPRDWANDVAEPDNAEPNSADAEHAASDLPAPARVESLRKELPPITRPQQYQMQFSTTEEHVQLVDRATALLATQTPRPSLGQLHLQATKLLVASLEKRKFAVTDRPRKPLNSAATEASATDTPGRHRTRHIPAAIRRAVFERDAGRCTYVDARGERCRETHGLQLHHREPFAKQGPDTPENLTLHCPSHNALAAEQDFGAEYIAERRTAANHTSLASEQRATRTTPSIK